MQEVGVGNAQETSLFSNTVKQSLKNSLVSFSTDFLHAVWMGFTFTSLPLKDNMSGLSEAARKR